MLELDIAGLRFEAFRWIGSSGSSRDRVIGRRGVKLPVLKAFASEMRSHMGWMRPMALLAAHS